MYVASTYMLGALLTPALAALLLPHAGWRGFSIAAAMPAAVCGVCVVSGLPESPIDEHLGIRHLELLNPAESPENLVSGLQSPSCCSVNFAPRDHGAAICQAGL